MSKSIGSSVGKGGKNRPEDVVVIQYLLNCVPSSKGGPTNELILDGLCGNLTGGAIAKFQQAALGFADGRVDAGGQTLAALNGYDPYPNQKLNLPASNGQGKSQGKRGGTPSSNSWDPFGYYNPAGGNYMKDGCEPAKYGGKDNGGKQSSDASAGKGGEKQASGGSGKSGGNWPTNPNQNTVLIGGGGPTGKTGQPQPGNIKGSQNDGGIVGKF